MIGNYAVILWPAYFLLMFGLCFLAVYLRIIPKYDIKFYLVYTLVMGGICVLVWYST